jgi:hypothetical protein
MGAARGYVRVPAAPMSADNRLNVTDVHHKVSMRRVGHTYQPADRRQTYAPGDFSDELCVRARVCKQCVVLQQSADAVHADAWVNEQSMDGRFR